MPEGLGDLSGNSFFHFIFEFFGRLLLFLYSLWVQNPLAIRSSLAERP